MSHSGSNTRALTLLRMSASRQRGSRRVQLVIEGASDRTVSTGRGSAVEMTPIGPMGEMGGLGVDMAVIA
jgi:hypothetical protein